MAKQSPVVKQEDREAAALREYFAAVEGLTMTWMGSNRPSGFYPNGEGDCDDDEDQDRWDRFMAARQAALAAIRTSADGEAVS